MAGNTIKAKVGFLLFVPTGTQSNKPMDSIEKKIPNLIASTEYKPMKDFEIAENFLMGGGAKFPHKRHFLSGPKLSLPDATAGDTHIVLTDFYDAGILEIAVNITLEVESVDTLIYLRQIFMAPVPITEDRRSITQLIGDIIAPLSLTTKGADFSYLVEINEFFNYTCINELFENEKNALYGIMSGDEGYQFLSDDLADYRLNSAWSSREFIKTVIFHNNFLLLNLNKIQRIADYEKRQTEFGGKFHGGANPYFFLDAESACLNHGVLFSIEVGMVAKSISSSVLERQVSRANTHKWMVGREIKRAKELRKDLILTLNRLENVGINEMDELDHLIVEGLDVDPLVEKIKYLLELLESELDLLYQTSTNALVNILTIIGLLLTVLGMITPLFS